MESTKAVLLLVLAVLSTSTANDYLKDKDVIYGWKATVKAGTHEPALYASQYTIHGKIHTQFTDTEGFIKISDVTYQLYNGELDHVQELEAKHIPISKEVEDLEKPFKIIYDEDGLVKGIVTQQKEKEFTRNIKKAIANVMQIKEEVMEKDYHHPEGMTVREKTIYGHDDVVYSIIPKEDKMIELIKTHDVAGQDEICEDVAFNKMISRNSKKTYVIEKREGHPVVKNVTTIGIITYNPFHGQSVSQFILVNQEFKLLEIKEAKEKYHMESEYPEDNITYHESIKMQDGIVDDITNGLQVVIYEKLIPKVQEMIKDIAYYLQENHIEAREPDTKRGQQVDFVRRLLGKFNVEKLEELHKTLPDDAMKVFYSVIPLVGTDASTLYIKNLVISKKVSDDVAKELLRHMADIAKPSVHLLTKLEELAHLDESFNWEVRKVAILTFGSLVHKSYMHHSAKHQSDVNVDDQKHLIEAEHKNQKSYEKYVTEYIKKMRETQEYKIQMAYVLGLYNMKLSMLAKHLVPAFNGEWWHHEHLRFLSIAAAGTAAVESNDENLIYETLWSILTNTEELTEIRMSAYYFIMMAEPSRSRLLDIFSFMLDEKDEELYHFHYTYVQAMIESVEPAMKEMRDNMSEMMHYVYPPTRGLSSVKVQGYKDMEFGFTAEVKNLMVNTNRSRFYGLSLSSQLLGEYLDDVSFYLKVHDGERTTTDFMSTITRMMSKFHAGPKSTHDETHVEAILTKRDYVIDFYYVGSENMQDAHEILDSFMKASKTMNKDFLHMSYYHFHKVLMPTDLGVPALWENMMPVVVQNNLTITKDTSDNTILRINIENKFVMAMHYRHGLSVYNPLAGVWQGINRAHAVDAVLPLNLEITANYPQSELKFTWKKHDDEQMRVAGLRTHVKQVVFVEDIYGQNLLEQSSPKSKEYKTVSDGKQFRHDYTLMEEDCLNTGRKWFASVFDSDLRITNGTFNHWVNLFTLPWTKQYDTPMDYLNLVMDNFYRRLFLSPDAGQYGFIIRTEPSDKVTEVDLSIKGEMVYDHNKNKFLPSVKHRMQIKYDVKNKEERLRTFDIDTIIDVNAGHTVTNLKVLIHRIVKDEKDVQMCLTGVKKWTDKDVTGHLNIGLTHDVEKCGKEDTFIDIEMKGERSHDQKDGNHKYAACEYFIPYSMSYYNSMKCLVAHSTVRHYVFDVKTNKVPTESKKSLVQWLDKLTGYYHSHHTQDFEHQEDMGDKDIKIDVVFPMETEEMDVKVITHDRVDEFSGLPTKRMMSFGVQPDSLAFSIFYKILHSKDLLDRCEIYEDHFYANHKHVSEEVPKDWTLYYGQAKDGGIGVYVKQVADKKIAVKGVDGDHTIEIIPEANNYKLSINGKTVPVEERREHIQDGIYFHVFNDILNKPVSVVLTQSGISFEYDPTGISVVYPKLASYVVSGRCLAKKVETGH